MKKITTIAAAIAIAITFTAPTHAERKAFDYDTAYIDHAKLERCIKETNWKFIIKEPTNPALQKEFCEGWQIDEWAKHDMEELRKKTDPKNVPGKALPEAICAAPNVCVCYSNCFDGFGPTPQVDTFVSKSVLNENITEGLTIAQGDQAAEECRTIRTTEYPEKSLVLLDLQRVVFCDHFCKSGNC